MKKRVFSILLVFVMLMSMLPVQVLADGSLTIKVGETRYLEAAHDYDAECVGWESSDSTVASIEDANGQRGCYGILKGLKKGTTTITHTYTVTSRWGGTTTKTETWTVTVVDSTGSSTGTQFAWNQVATSDAGTQAAGDATGDAVGKVSVQYYGLQGALKTLDEKVEIDWDLVTSNGVIITAAEGWKITGISMRCNDNDGVNCSTFSSHMLDLTKVYTGISKSVTLTGAEVSAMWQAHVDKGGTGRGDPYWMCISVAKDTEGNTDVQKTYDVTYLNDTSLSPNFDSTYVATDSKYVPTRLDNTDVNPITGKLLNSEFDAADLNFLNAEDKFGGYKFLGWYVEYSEDDGTTWEPALQHESLVAPGTTVAVKGDVRLTAKWQLVEEDYTVTYTDGVEDEEVFADQVHLDLKVGTGVPAFKGTPTRDGYIFDGWVNEHGTPMTPETDTVTGNMVYIASWKPDIDVAKQVSGIIDKDNAGVEGHTAPIGGTVTWTITITNNSPEEQTFTLEEVLTSDPASSAARGLTSRVPTVTVGQNITANENGTYTIPANTTDTLTATYTTTIADSTNTLNNTATIHVGEHEFSDTAPGVPVAEAAAKLSVTKDVTSIVGTGTDRNYTGLDTKSHEELPEAKLGEVITWRITVTNSGTGSGEYVLLDKLMLEGVNIAVPDTIHVYRITEDADGEKVENPVDAATYTVEGETVYGTKDAYSIAPEETHTYLVKYTVTEADQGKTLSNYVRIVDKDVDLIDTDYAEEVDVEGKKYEVNYNYTSDVIPVPDGAPALPAAAEYEHEESVTVEDVPTMNGYIFVGWRYASDDKPVSSTFEMPAHDVTLEGHWIPKLDVEKTLSEDITGPVPVGENSKVTWNIKVTNNTDANQIFTLTDKLVTNDGEDLSSKVTISTEDLTVTKNNDGTWTLSANSSADFTATYTPAAIDNVYGDVLKNTATVIVDGVRFSDDSDKDPTVEHANGELHVSKVADKSEAEVGDTIVWTITVTNTGNTDLSNVTLTDEFVKNALYENKACAESDKLASNVIASLAAGASEVVYAKYVVQPSDAGTTIKNTVIAKAGDETTDDGSSEVPVKARLVVELYYDEVAEENLVAGYGADLDLETGAAWNVVVDGYNTANHITYRAPRSLTKVDGTETTNYTFDYVDDPGVLSGTMQETVTVQLVYAPDEIGEQNPDEPDNIPDKYQVTINYLADENGEITSNVTTEVLTIKNGNDFAQSGNVNIHGATAAATTVGYGFEVWNLYTTGSEAAEANYTKDNPLTNPSDGLAVEGGKTYNFKAYFVKTWEVPNIEVVKTVIDENGNDLGENHVVKADDVVMWQIKITNKGTLPVTVSVVDTLMADNVNVSKDVKLLNLNADGTVTVPAGTVENNYVIVLAQYTVPAGMEGKVLNNHVDVTAPDGPDGGNEPDVDEKDDAPGVTVEKTEYTVHKYLLDKDNKKVIPPVTEALLVNEGDTINWVIEVHNTGNVAQTITVKDVLQGAKGSLSYTDVANDNIEYVNGVFTITDLAPSEKPIQIPVSYTVLAADEGEIINGIEYTDDEGKKQEEETPGVTVAEKKVAISKSVDKSTAQVGETLTYTITVRNTGDVVLDEVEIKDNFSSKSGTGITYVDDKDDNVVYDNGVFTVTNIPTSGIVVIKYTYEVKLGDVGEKIANSVAQTTGIPEDGDDDKKEEVEVEENHGLSVVKTAYAVNGIRTTDFEVETGDEVTWSIKVTNTGNVKLENVSVKDTLTVGSKTVTLDVYDKMGSDAVRVETVDLEVGGEVTLYASYTVKAEDAGKTLSNSVVVKGSDGNSDPTDDPQDEDTNDEAKVEKPDAPVVGPLPSLNKKDHVAYIIGYEDETVRPQNNITRAEVATIFFRLLTDDSRAFYWSQVNDFSDVSKNDWFNNAVSTMSNAGIITGYPDGTFGPNKPITRAEFAAIAARFSDVVYNGESRFTDVLKSHWAWDEIALAEHLGWITGYPDDTFRPDRNITRAEAMTLINRVLERAVEEEHMLPDMVTWIDNRPTDWFYEAVQEATNSHAYTRLNKRVPDQSFNFEDWVKILEVPDWAALEKSWSTANSN